LNQTSSRAEISTTKSAITASPSLSLVIAVYDKAEDLRFVLAGCARQSFTDFEVIIADDGSGPDVKHVISEAQQSYTFPIIHLWHEDRGWRKNTMLNNGIRAARGEHIVFIDGDCIPGRHFLLDHWNEREPGKLLLGRRVETSERWSKMLTIERIRNGDFERFSWSDFADLIKRNSLRIEDGVRLTSPLLRRLLLRNVRGMLGSNFSAAKNDLEAVNGFDELYDGPGCGEDSDIQFRLSLIGITGKSLRNLAIQYHIYHPPTKTSQACWDRFQMVKISREPRCEVGLKTTKKARLD
jgi:glycosyltransferase involved in cell wall biosynthesis